MITLGGSLFVVALLVGFAALALRKRAQQAQSALKWRRNFYEHATILVKDERTPKHIVNILEFMGQGIASRLLLWELITFSDNRPAEVAQDHRREIGAMIENLPPDIKENFYNAVADFVVALTLNNILLGWIVRHWFRKFGQDGNKDQTAKVVRMATRHNPPEDNLAPAA